jgi:hypothetical protein
VFLLRWREDDLQELERSWGLSLRFQDVTSSFVTQSTTSATAFTAPFVASAAASTSDFANASVEADNLFEEEAEGGDVHVGTGAYELDHGTISDEDQANLIEEVLQDSDEEEEEVETSTTEASADCLQIQWEYTVCQDTFRSCQLLTIMFCRPQTTSTSP